MWNGRPRVGQVGGDGPAWEEHADKAPQGGREPRGVSGALPARLRPQEGRDVWGAECLQSERCTATPLTENTPDGIEGVAHGRWRQATRVKPEVLNVARDAVARPGGGLDSWDGNHPWLSQLPTQPPPDGAIMTVGMTALRAVLQKGIHALFVEVRGREGVSLEPAAEVGE